MSELREIPVSEMAWGDLLIMIKSGLDREEEVLRRFGGGMPPASRAELEVLLAEETAQYRAVFGETPWQEEDEDDEEDWS